MHIGVFSDVHDNLRNLEAALSWFSQQGCSTLIFCGDFCSPIPARIIGKYDGTVHCVFGNGDGDRFHINNLAHSEYRALKLHGEHAELALDGCKIAVTHYPFYARALARTGDYRAVFSGHTHEQNTERIGECLWLNPGEVLGWKGHPTCALYDTSSHLAEVHSLL